MTESEFIHEIIIVSCEKPKKTISLIIMFLNIHDIQKHVKNPKKNTFFSFATRLKKKMCEKTDAIIFMAFSFMVGIENSTKK